MSARHFRSIVLQSVYAHFVLKDTEELLGLVIRYPLYHEETFNGFFVVVLNIIATTKSGTAVAIQED